MLYFVKTIDPESDSTDCHIVTAPNHAVACEYFPTLYITEIAPLTERHIDANYDSVATLATPFFTRLPPPPAVVTVGFLEAEERARQQDEDQAESTHY